MKERVEWNQHAGLHEKVAGSSWSQAEILPVAESTKWPQAKLLNVLTTITTIIISHTQWRSLQVIL